MHVLVVGSAGREHALVWALRHSPGVDKIYCTPGNAGIASIAECWGIVPGDLDGIARAADEHGVDLVVVGPEAPLTSGLADIIGASGIPCFGPSRRASVIEGSKAFAKSFLQRHGIPTGRFEVFSDAKSASEFASDCPWGFPIVVKADGLAAGKGVVVCANSDEAREAVHSAMVDKAFGRAGDRVVIEEFLTGTEATIMTLCDGENALPLLPSQDHKPAYDGDTGPNTGGMGAFAPASNVADAELVARVRREILQPTIAGLAAEDRVFRGVLYAGLMIDDDGPKVLEYNCRFGDPETQAVVPLLDEDFGELLAHIAEGGSLGSELKWRPGSAACVIVASEGYPGKARQGDRIEGLDQIEGRDDVLVFHSGTSRDGDNVVTAGGRVLGITGLGDDLDGALTAAYTAISKIDFPGMHFRSDIGRRPAGRTS